MWKIQNAYEKSQALFDAPVLIASTCSLTFNAILLEQKLDTEIAEMKREKNVSYK